ncbi:MAG: hypothetical protein U0746_10640 [Gemmataceae bacterium]
MTPTNPTPNKTDDREPLGSPYGPQPHGTDEAAGGADSSPFDTESTDAAADAAADERRRGER